ncbi:hypothetical protein CCACVL1_22136 [Corchorus capsularis]|uniref:Uncharacterized protein n=1 Tax=Corchorus capsularis TaxID=210143 RepID=A0A1R3H0V7_COCAP|nr:hypothetical protein CCACVL1_22136 [Corchorus capsularis]
MASNNRNGMATQFELLALKGSNLLVMVGTNMPFVGTSMAQTHPGRPFLLISLMESTFLDSN